MSQMTEPTFDGKTTGELIRELGGGVCRCGKQKRRRQTFCRACYYSLPHTMRRALYNLVGEGYEQAYQAAAERLGPSKL